MRSAAMLLFCCLGRKTQAEGSGSRSSGDSALSGPVGCVLRFEVNPEARGVNG